MDAWRFLVKVERFGAMHPLVKITGGFKTIKEDFHDEYTTQIGDSSLTLSIPLSATKKKIILRHLETQGYKLNPGRNPNRLSVGTSTIPGAILQGALTQAGCKYFFMAGYGMKMESVLWYNTYGHAIEPWNDQLRQEIYDDLPPSKQTPAAKAVIFFANNHFHLGANCINDTEHITTFSLGHGVKKGQHREHYHNFGALTSVTLPNDQYPVHFGGVTIKEANDNDTQTIISKRIIYVGQIVKCIRAGCPRGVPQKITNHKAVISAFLKVAESYELIRNSIPQFLTGYRMEITVKAERFEILNLIIITIIIIIIIIIIYKNIM
ncbi:MAG: hypothetical protein P4M12_06015 [Gammaproteobacteria bacterium]|nr:hypothetical protein [Gammaproteobacteria bacterium]